MIADAIVWGIWFVAYLIWWALRRRRRREGPRARCGGIGARGAGRSRAADNTIFRLRAKIERSPARPRHVITVQGEGYRFEA